MYVFMYVRSKTEEQITNNCKQEHVKSLFRRTYYLGNALLGAVEAECALSIGAVSGRHRLNRRS